MRKIVAILTIGAMSLGMNLPAQASDWETFGKVMAGVEGLRVITGGQVDIIGSLTGARRDGARYYYPARFYRYRRPYGRDCYRRYSYPYGYYCYPKKGTYYYGPRLGYRIIVRYRDRNRKHNDRKKHENHDGRRVRDRRR